MGLLELKDFSLSFGDKVIFQNANFVVNKGDKMGVVGVNGAGKSTLLKIINKEIFYDTGSYQLNPKIKLGYLDQKALIDSDKNVIDYLRESFQNLFDADRKLSSCYEKMAVSTSEEELLNLNDQIESLMAYLQNNDFYSIESKIFRVAEGLGITDFGLESKVRTLSGGQRAKVRLAKLLLEKPDVMLLDEPTNFLDVSHIEWLSNYLLNFDGTFVVVSHDENFLAKVTNCICDIDNKVITRYNLGFKEFESAKVLAKDQQQRNYDRQQKKIDSMTKLIDRFRYKATKASMVQSRIKVLDKMEKIEPPTEHFRPTFLFSYKRLGSKILLEVNNLVIGYDKPLLKKPLNIVLERSDKVAITGFNGIGKSTFLKTIAGKIKALGGDFKLATNVVIGYYEQELNFESENQTPLEYILSEYPLLTETQARSHLAKCGINATHIKEPLKKLSGGEQCKVKICELMLFPCNILILDEPTNHMDHNAMEQLSVAIQKFEGTVLFVSHDQDFVKKNAQKIISFEDMLK